MPKTVLCCQIVLLATMLLPANAVLARDIVIETISISADEAREDTEPGILHFTGHFIMQSEDWQLESARATVHGQPDRPDKVYLQGSPARFLISRQQGNDQSRVEATAPEVEYQRSGNLLKLSGGAMLKLDGEVIRSKVIEYNISTDRYRAEGVDGVMIEVPANN
jgi:lipopolysaccharide transport protein LptA